MKVSEDVRDAIGCLAYKAMGADYKKDTKASNKHRKLIAKFMKKYKISEITTSYSYSKHRITLDSSHRGGIWIELLRSEAQGKSMMNSRKMQVL